MIRFLFLFSISCLIAKADSGDTTFVQVHNNVDMVWYEHYKEWGEFPTGELSYRKVLMHFTMGCASSGCSGWDYDVHILLRNRTGKIDSNLILAPSFKLNNEIVDSASISVSPTYTNVWDSINGTSTQTANDTLILLLFEDADNPLLATDTQLVFAANYYNPIFDAQGTVIDSTLVGADTTLFLGTTDVYVPFEVIEDFELGRAITPYGTYMNPSNNGYGTNGYNQNWKHVFTYDVTDFQHLLKDSVEIDAFYSGWSSGFSVTLDFEFIEGTPPRNPIRLTNVYKNGAAGYNYTSSNDFESNQMPEVKVPIHANAEEFKLQFVPSGHGQAGEFTPNISYTVKVNGNLVGGNPIWKDDCGFNAIWPQGGTWIFNRANWCPGEAVPIFNHEVTPYIDGQDSARIDINFSAFNPNGDASYSCAVQLFQYKEPNFNLDAEIIDILSPSTKDVYSRFNPVCDKPTIKIRNSGSELLTSLDIEYGIEGGNMQIYQWTGNLEFMQEEEITLNQLIQHTTNPTFVVTLSNPNGENDEHPDNDSMRSSFENVPTYKSSFIIRLQTNNKGNHNSWKLTNNWGGEVYSRNNLSSNTYYADTVTLANGCYTFELYDTGGDGLDFWYWNQYDGNSDGDGYINFMYYDTLNVFKSFHKDFGSGIYHAFRVTNGVDIDTHTIGKFDVYPTMNKGEVTIKSHDISHDPYTISLYAANGQKVIHKKWDNHTDSYKLDISSFSDGMYILKLQNRNSIFTEKIMLSH